MRLFLFNRFQLLCCGFLFLFHNGYAQTDSRTYAEKLGYPKTARVIIFHVDDAGMSLNSNQGAINSIEKGIATSTSIMMPCPWAMSFAKYAAAKGYDAGLHLTLTSEWNDYRWPPLAGIKNVPGLVDPEMCLWPEAEDVTAHASADEVDKEIRAQLARALAAGLHPTHFDSHMGTLFERADYLEKYIQLGIENGIPVMFPGGNNKMLSAEYNKPLIEKLKAAGKYQEGMILPLPDRLKISKETGIKIWNAGLPVLDDLFTNSGDWTPAPVNGVITPSAHAQYKVEQFEKTIGKMEPGLAMYIVHSTQVSDDFRKISNSGDSRNADMLAMMDPGFKIWLQNNGVILTTWREVMERRKKVK